MKLLIFYFVLLYDKSTQYEHKHAIFWHEAISKAVNNRFEVP